MEYLISVAILMLIFAHIIIGVRMFKEASQKTKIIVCVIFLVSCLIVYIPAKFGTEFEDPVSIELSEVDSSE